MKAILWGIYCIFIFCLAMATINDEFQKLSVGTRLWILATAFAMVIREWLFLYIGYTQ